MNRQSKRFLMYVALLVLTHAVGVSVSNLEVVGYKTLLYYLIVFFPLIIMPLGFSFKIQSWQQFIAYLSVTIIVWQLAFILDDWMMGRLGDPLWLRDKAGTWGAEIVRRCIAPVILISVGALISGSKKTPRFPSSRTAAERP